MPRNDKPAISFRDAEVNLGDHTIWAHVDLDIQPGEFVAVLGPNGSGKSTLLKAILGLQTLATGSLHVLDHPAGQSNKRVAYLPQRRSFDAALPIRGTDIVRLGVDGHKWGWPVPFVGSLFNRDAERQARLRVNQAIERVDATEYADRPIGKTSGGEQQRLLIAQALVRDPAILLLDEPLDSLDLPNQHSISSLIKTIATEHNITVLMVAHDVNPILPFIDRVIYVANGHALVGSPEEVIRTETLSKLYGSTVEVLKTADGRMVVVGAPDSVHAHNHVAR